MFARKKGGAPGEKVDVGKAIGEMDKEVLKQVGGEIAQSGKKEVRMQRESERESTDICTEIETLCKREAGLASSLRAA